MHHGLNVKSGWLFACTEEYQSGRPWLGHNRNGLSPSPKKNSPDPMDLTNFSLNTLLSADLRSLLTALFLRRCSITRREPLTQSVKLCNQQSIGSMSQQIRSVMIARMVTSNGISLIELLVKRAAGFAGTVHAEAGDRLIKKNSWRLFPEAKPPIVVHRQM